MKKTITITIEEFFDDRLPESDRFLAYISDGYYRGTVETGPSILEALKEVGISIEVKDKYVASLNTSADAVDNR